MWQAEDRAHRIGQKRAVLVLVLVVAGTVEMVILNRAREKRDIDAKVIQVHTLPQMHCPASISAGAYSCTSPY